ncbi:ketosteroid isomerase-like protein [Streptacidiphilus sp. BW17]|uniref:nuclear transport factor 2 family protein n=1 Tax=Streptacidiphilus sp. BW17 TaxID=3156274 RepID=UPI0035134171
MNADRTGQLTEELRSAERRLQAAQLAADADALDVLLDDRLVFTGPDGRLYGKNDDLEIQKGGRQRLTRVDEEDLTVLVDGATGVTWFLGTLAGALEGQEFTARVRYTRTWVHTPGNGWRVVAAHVSPA